MKGVILPDHIPVNKYVLTIAGMPPLVATEISGLEEELQTAELPDRTRASGGNTGPSEFTMKIPMHHRLEQAAMELWFKASQDPVAIGYKHDGALIHFSLSGLVNSSRALFGMFPTKRKDPDKEMANAGDLAVVEWTVSVDKILPA